MYHSDSNRKTYRFFTVHTKQQMPSNIFLKAFFKLQIKNHTSQLDKANKALFLKVWSVAYWYLGDLGVVRLKNKDLLNHGL